MTVAVSVAPTLEIEITAACERIALDYAHFADNGRMADLASLFAEDGEFHVFGKVHVGPAAILESLGASPGRTASRIHSLSNHRVEVISASEARGTVYVTAYVFDKAAPSPAIIAPAMIGIYHDVYRSTGDGWRLARREFEPLIARAS